MADYATIKAKTVEALDAAMTKPKPSYAIDGQSVDHDEYVKRLRETIDWCDKKIREGSDDDEGGSVEVTTYGV